jgi:hypothetical protein
MTLLRAHPFFFRVQINIMSVPVKNIQVGKSSVNTRLASTGVCSCIAAIIGPEAGATFIHHIDLLNCNIKAANPREECIKLIKMTMKRFQKRKDDSSFGEIFVDGGLNNDNYQQLHDTFNLLSTNHSARANGPAE